MLLVLPIIGLWISAMRISTVLCNQSLNQSDARAQGDTFKDACGFVYELRNITTECNPGVFNSTERGNNTSDTRCVESIIESKCQHWDSYVYIAESIICV